MHWFIFQVNLSFLLNARALSGKENIDQPQQME
jgi:hypothetical protein